MSLSRIFTAFALVLVAILAATCVAAQKNAALSGSRPYLNAVFIPVAFTHTLARETASEHPPRLEDPPVTNNTSRDAESIQAVAQRDMYDWQPPTPGRDN